MAHSILVISQTRHAMHLYVKLRFQVASGLSQLQGQVLAPTRRKLMFLFTYLLRKGFLDDFSFIFGFSLIDDFSLIDGFSLIEI